MPANLAKDAVSLNGKMILLRARTSFQISGVTREANVVAESRKTFKAVFGAPKVVPALSQLEETEKRPLEDEPEDPTPTKKVKV